MIKNRPSMEEVTEKIAAIVEETVELKVPLKVDVPLIKELGLDSLDLIETSFSLEEFFGFEFSDKNAIEELNEALGDDSVISSGVMTPLGVEMLLKRMPELKKATLPEQFNPVELQQFYTIETFARLILEYYLETPDRCPETDEPVVVEDFKLLTEETKQPVQAPTGDVLIERWVAKTLKEMKG